MSLIRSKDKFVHGAWAKAENVIESIDLPEGVLFFSFLEDWFNYRPNWPRIANTIKSPWIGIIHTPIDSYKFNGEERYKFGGKGFLDSMKNCKGLFLMSTAEKKKWQKYAKKLKLKDLKVESLIHPARKITYNFNWDRFNINNEKKVIQSGYWLRKIYSIFNLNTHYNENTRYEWHKAIKPFDKWNKKQLEKCCNRDNVTIDEWRHKWVKKMRKTNHEKYELLLASNIFYLDLYDFTSNNTIIDCITSSTPVLVNKHPAAEEYLGKDYPLLFKSKSHAEEMLQDIDLIKSAHIYLKNKDKSHFSYDHFKQSIINSDIYKSL